VSPSPKVHSYSFTVAGGEGVEAVEAEPLNVTCRPTTGAFGAHENLATGPVEAASTVAAAGAATAQHVSAISASKRAIDRVHLFIAVRFPSFLSTQGGPAASEDTRTYAKLRAIAAARHDCISQ
jgi:hypothetical protein